MRLIKIIDFELQREQNKKHQQQYLQANQFDTSKADQ